MTTTHHIIGAAHQSSDGATNIRSRPVRGWSLAGRGLVTGWSLSKGWLKSSLVTRGRPPRWSIWPTAALHVIGAKGCVPWSWQCSINREWCNANTPLHGVRLGEAD